MLRRDGRLVVRPDSGDPPTVLLEVLEILGQRFGYEINAKGYRVLCPKIRVIQGDAIDYKMIGRILAALESRGWSAENLAFGSGGGLLQRVNRDTLEFAFKSSFVRIHGTDHDIFKKPVTGLDKISKRGRMKLVRKTAPEADATSPPQYETVGPEDPRPDEMVEVFRDGRLLVDQTFESIRKRAAIGVY